MPGTIILQKSGSNHLVSGQSVQKGDKLEFDMITERWYFGAGVPATYEAGGTAKPSGLSGGKWVCLGPSDVEKLPGGPEIATISWKGLINITTVTIAQETFTIRETSWDALSGPMLPSSNLNAVTRDLTNGYSVKSLGTTEVSRPTWSYAATTGKLTLTNPGFTLTEINATGTLDITTDAAHKTYNVPWGWIPVSWEQNEPLPGFFSVSAEYKWIPKITFG